MAWEYSEKTKQLFMDAIHGREGTHLGEIPNPDGLGEHGSISCGDAIRFTFRVERHPSDPLRDLIVEAKYLTFGCTSAIASSEALCAIIEDGRFTPIEALKIKNEDIVAFLEGLPQQKIHCSVMGAEALESAVFNWAVRRKVDLAELGIDIHTDEQEDGRIVCKCFSLTEPYLRRKIEELDLKTISQITGAIKAGGACMSCHHTHGGLQDLLNEIWGKNIQKEADPFAVLPAFDATREPAVEAAAAIDQGSGEEKEKLSPYQFSKKVESVFEEYVRPVLQHDGGDVEIVDIKGMLIYCRFQGACAGCPGAAQTIKMMIEQPLKDNVDERIQVIQV
jgi:NifU-like protein